MKNQKSSILALSFALMGMLSCNSVSTTIEETPIIESTAPTAEASTPSDLPPLSSIPESTPPVSANTPPPSSANLGGPLGVINSTVPSSSAPLASLAPAASSAPLSAPKTAVSTARLNPAHGQPGHDCSIAVGAPLKNTASAKPAQATAQPVVASTPTLETKTVAAPAVANVPNLNPNAKLNPAHGQPGHDCAVAVGAPLPLK
jgi:hypothetical protein